MTLRKLIYKMLQRDELNLDQLFEQINIKNNIARATIRGRLSEMVRAGEVRKIGGDPDNKYSKDIVCTFKSIPIKDRVKIPAQMLTTPTQ